MEIRLLYENELQLAVDIAHETYEVCVRPYGRTQGEAERYYRYVNVGHLWQMMRDEQLFLWGVFENGQMCAVSAMQRSGNITMLYVKPHCQKRKMGAQLVNHMCAYVAQILHLDRVTVHRTPVVMAPFFYHIGFSLIQGAPLVNGEVSLECRFWMQQDCMPPEQPMGAEGQFEAMGAGVGVSAGMANVHGVPANRAYRSKRPEVVYQTKKVGSRVIALLAAGILLLSAAIIAGVTIHYMIGNGVLSIAHVLCP